MEKVRTNPRQLFLNQLGLQVDPFAYSVSEFELQHSAYLAGLALKNGSLEVETTSAEIPFLEYYVQPPIAHPANQTTSQVLRQLQPTFIFGASGSGKTMLRLKLETDIRLVPNHTLAVTHLFRKPQRTYWLAIAQSLSIDLFIQFIEQYTPSTTLPVKK